MRSYLILGMSVLFLVQYFLGLVWLQYMVVAIALLAFIGSAAKADVFPRSLGFVMMGAGFIIEWGKGTGINGISEGIFLILPLLSLLTLAPLISLPLRVGGYFDAVAVLLHKLLSQPKKLYLGITGTLFLLGPILNLGSVRIVNEFLEDMNLPPRLSAKSYLVGFSTAILWSPYFASVSLVLSSLDVSFNEFIVYGLGFSLMSLFIGNVLFAFWARGRVFSDQDTEDSVIAKSHQLQMAKLVLFVFILLISCLVIEFLTHWSMIVIVSLVSVSIPVIYSAFSKNRHRMIGPLRDYRDRTVPMMNNEIMLFMSAGMLAFALKGTDAAKSLTGWLTELANTSFFLFAIALMAIVLSITFIGIHQIAAVGALAMQLNPADLGMSNTGLALLLLLTWSISTALSPFSGLNLMVSKIAGISGVQTGYRSNGLHLLILGIVGIAIISIIG